MTHRVLLGLSVGLLFGLAQTAFAQLAPEIGYAHPSGGRAGTTVDVILGGYDWTPDMQVFVHDPRIKLEIVGPPSPVLVPDPPYWFGAKGRGPAWPIPREVPARLTIQADVPPGLVRWQVANANGASPVGFIHVGSVPETVEDSKRKTAQVLPALPVTVSGRIGRIEEIDRYQFSVPKAAPITIELVARRLNSPLHGMLQVRDATGHVVLDVADTEGRDLTTTLVAQPDMKYELSLHDLDFAGDRSYVYRLTLTAGPHVLAAYPAAGKRGETRPIEFVGIGLASGTDKLESITREVAFPTTPDATSFAYALETPFGQTKPFTLLVTDAVEQVETVQPAAPLSAPAAITGSIETRFGSDQHLVAMKKGEKVVIAAQARAIGSPLDLEVAVFDADGKQLATDDDSPGTTDAEIAFVAPADATYRIVVTDRSGKSGSRAANYRLSIRPQREDVTLSVPALLAIPLGAQAKLAVKAVRIGGFKGAIPVTLSGLPAGVTAPPDLMIPEGKNDLAIDLACAADAAAGAALCTVTASPQFGDRKETRSVGSVLLATTMKPRIKITPEGLDDVRKIQRGSTFLAPLLIERLEGYAGPITLEMTAKQQRHRQGLASDEFVVAPDAKRVEYPIFVPEWMETTKTSRMILNGAVKVADPKGNVRMLLQRQELRIGILPEGALMKLSHGAGEMTGTAGSEVRIPLSLSIASALRDPIEIKVVPAESQAGLLSADPIVLQPGQKDATLVVRLATDPRLHGEQSIAIRATSLKDGRWPVISETSVLVTVRPAP